MNWKTALVALMVLSGTAWLLMPAGTSPEVATSHLRDTANQSPDGRSVGESALGRLLDHVPRMLSTPVVTSGGNGSGQQANGDVILQQFQRLREMQPGSDAITLAQQLESALTPGNSDVYIHALLATDHPAIERVALTALARSADTAMIQTLASHYGNTSHVARGRILQVLEAAENPAATGGLAAIVTAEVSEKRSPVMMSALYGIANTGTVDSVQYLLQQLNTDNAEYAVMALERVRSSEGLEMIRAAAEGSKDSQEVSPSLAPALRRIAQAATRS